MQRAIQPATDPEASYGTMSLRLKEAEIGRYSQSLSFQEHWVIRARLQPAHIKK